MNKLIAGFEKKTTSRQNNLTLTENSALTNASTKSAVLDFFSKSGALRGHTAEYLALFQYAYAENPLLAVKALFYSRNIRGIGQGERENFRQALYWLAKTHPFKDAVLKNLHLVSEFGRWDDLFVLLSVPEFRGKVIRLLNTQLKADLYHLERGQGISLLAKWLPSENASSKETRALAKMLRGFFGMSSREYRQALSKLRSKLRIVEREMSNRNWSEIDYSIVPSRANKVYSRAFLKHDLDRRLNFLKKAEKGEVKIKSSTLDPDEIAKMAFQNSETAQALWNALPDFSTEHNILNIADTSSSMYSDGAIWVSVALTIYSAQHNRGAFAGKFLTFEEKPHWNTIGTSEKLSDIVRKVYRSSWGGSTNLERAFDVLLKTAIDNDVPQEDMPSVISIVSDMQFNQGVGKYTFTTHETIKAKFRQAGYDMPVIVYWNVRASKGQPVVKDDIGTVLLSGRSLGNFKALMGMDLEYARTTPYDAMLEILNSETFSEITI